MPLSNKTIQTILAFNLFIIPKAFVKSYIFYIFGLFVNEMKVLYFVFFIYL